MGKTVTFNCDRCGNTIPTNSVKFSLLREVRWMWLWMIDGSKQEEFIICKNCVVNFHNWMKK